MNKNQSPTMDEWKLLYEAADEFKKVAPWEWLEDTDLICVGNPEDGMIGYCSIMGAIGECYALGLYLGANGIYGFNEMLMNKDTIPMHQIVHLQDCIMCSFDDIEYVSPVDEKIIKTLGLKYKGASSWPVFRRFEPGFNPWYITSSEARFITMALKQSIIVALGIKEGSVTLDKSLSTLVLRSYNKKLDCWKSSEIRLSIPTLCFQKVEIENDILIHTLRGLKMNSSMSIEVDTMYFLQAVLDKSERPHFPRFFIITDAKSGMVLKQELYEDIMEDSNIIICNLIELFKEIGLPSSISVRNERVGAMVDDLCEKVGIKLKLKKTLPKMDKVLDELNQNIHQ